ncbi:hypothetical protein M407DRAFT_200248 [Tulasnella calospora MUT 4182]|uniref:F-box domain-containing protein n=1 Tax=Tulasnella calospora MUT 4182 TaxID=1051891 RepID=A0A0C3Q9B9_9AGAM|nr:hypothetical protein M407DRAFT_200248 [Tulasnella calospora MUT 4182]
MWRPPKPNKQNVVRLNLLKGVESGNPRSSLPPPDVDYLVTRLDRLSLEPSMLQYLLGRSDESDIATSPVLLPELLSIVFSFCSSQDLSSAARVCKTWSELALDCIWADMTSLVPLYSVMPCIRRAMDGKGHYLADVLTDKQYDRFLFYAKRVRSLVLPETETPIPVSLSFVLHQRCTILRFGPLFPRLTKVEWAIDSDVENNVAFLQTLLLLTSPSLRTLILSLKSRPSKICPPVLHVFASLPNIKLKHFRLTLTNACFVEHHLLTLIDKQKELVELRAPQISFTPLSLRDTLAGLPHLRQLDISMRIQRPDESTELEIALRSIADLGPLMEILRLGITPTAKAGTSTSIWIPASSLRPLLACNALTKLDIVCNKASLGPWGTQDIVDMGKSWREMAELSICEGIAPDQHSGICLSLLPTFAANFSSTLTRLCVPFKNYQHDAVLKLSDQPPKTVLQSVRGLGTFNEPIADPDSAKQVGRYIVAFCPMVVTVYSKPPMDPMVRELTGAINEMRRDICGCEKCKR